MCRLTLACMQANPCKLVVSLKSFKHASLNAVTVGHKLASIPASLSCRQNMLMAFHLAHDEKGVVVAHSRGTHTECLHCHVQGAHTASQLALQLRKLDSYIQWEALKRPALDADSPLASAEILQRRPADAPNKGWDYLIQMASAETSTAVGLGPISGDRQPLQPLTAVPGAQQPHHQQQQQQLMSKQVLPQLPGESLAPLQRLQEGEQRQQQSAQIPNQALSVLPNHVAVQQHQQAFAAREDKQIAVQQAANTLSDAKLPRQLPAIAESASRPSESAMPDQAQADNSIPNGLPPDPSAGLDETVGAIRRDARAKQPPQLGIVPSQTQTAAHLDPLPETVPGSGASIGDLNQHLHGAQTGVSDAKLSQQTEAQVKPEASPLPSSLSPSAPHPTPAPTPFLAQQPPQQANSLLSLVPHKEHRPSLAASSAHATGQFGRAQGQGAAAGPSREGTPALKGAPTWLHESQLPLWLVKAFEEKRRRDVAMVAARAAQQAQRDANAASRGVVHLLHPWRNECTPCCLVTLSLPEQPGIIIVQWTAWMMIAEVHDDCTSA